MKINRAVAVPVGALTQRSGQDLRNQIAKISNLFDSKGLQFMKCILIFLYQVSYSRRRHVKEGQLSLVFL